MLGIVLFPVEKQGITARRPQIPKHRRAGTAPWQDGVTVYVRPA